jgi:hypothetical protein
MNCSNKRAALIAAALAATVAVGVFVRQARRPQSSVAPPADAGGWVAPTAAAAAIPAGPLFDYSGPEADAVLNAVLADWFTSPGRRESALALLVDPMAGPFDGSRPALKRVVVDSRTVPGSYRPRVPGLAAVVANGRETPPLGVGELRVWVEHFAVLSDGSVRVEFTESNHGYVCKTVVYTAEKGEGGWRARFVSEE